MTKKTSRKDHSSMQKEVDIWLIRDNLNSSYEDRIARHQDTLNCIDTLKGLGSARRAKSTKAPSVSRPKSP